MKRILSTAAAALFIVGAATGCTSKTATKYDTDRTLAYGNHAISSTDRTALEYNGIHDGTYLADDNGRVITRNYRTLTDDLKIAGRDVKYGVERTADDIGNGVRHFASDMKNGMENTIDYKDEAK